MPRAIDPELLAEAQSDKNKYSGGGSLQFYDVPDDGKKHKVRVLPGTFGKSKKKWFVASAQHWSNRKAYECPQLSEKGPCPFCDYVKELRQKEQELKEKQKKAPEEQQAKLDRQIKKLGKIITGLVPKPRYLVNLLDRDEAGHIVRVARMPKTLFTPIFDVWESADDVDVLDPLKGHDFHVSRAKVNGLTKYSATTVLSSTPIADSQDVIDKILGGLPNLEKLVKQTDFSELETALTDAVKFLNEEASKAPAEEPAAKKAPPVNLEEEAEEAETPPAAKKEEPKKAPATPKDPEPEPAQEETPAPAAKSNALKNQLNSLLDDTDDE